MNMKEPHPPNPSPEQTMGADGVFATVWNSLKLHLDSSQRKSSVLLLALIFISAVLDVFGIASILPLIKLATDPEAIHQSEMMDSVYNYLGFEEHKSFLLFIILVVLFFFIVKSVFGIYVNYLETRFTAKLAYNITRKQFNKYFNLEYHDFSSVKSSVATHHILNNPLSYVTWIVMPSLMILSEGFILLFIITAIALYDIKLFLFVGLLIGPATWLIYALLRKRVTAIGEEMNRLFPQSIASLQQAIHGYIDIKLANKVEFYRDVFLNNQKRYHQLNMASHLPSLIPLRANELVALSGVVLIFIYAIFLTDQSGEAILMISMFAAAAYRMMPSLNRLVNSMMYIRKNMTALQNLSIYPDLAREINTTDNDTKLRFEDSIEIKNLSFRFPSTQSAVLQNISMNVKKGEKIGIVGPSGSGKTTLMNVFLRFYEEQEGGIYVDGEQLERENILQWRNMLGYVKQDIFLLDGTIIENIAFGDSNPDLKRVNSAIQQSSLEQLIKELPEGIHTKIGERGSRISGGQRQRISIARSLYRNAEILIFDEATSALDTQTEQEVSESIDSLSDAHKTIFIIAHRITTLKNCDRIYELENGRIKGIHTYRQLLDKVI
jgi:ABC-type multidrug transport system fused ATPase/permease subunit